MITAREQQPEPASAAMLTRAPGQRLPDLLVRYFRAGWHQGELAGRIHPAADASALQAGCTVTRAVGRSGFGSRTYRDRRFDRPRPEGTGKGPG